MEAQGRRRLPQLEATGVTLKWYACITLLFYSLSMTVLQRGLLGIEQQRFGELRQMMAGDARFMVLSSWAVVFQLLGGLGIPVVAFLLVEGFVHTKNYTAYLLRLLLFGLVSEIPFDYAMTGKCFYWGSQNLLFTLAVGLVMLYGLRLFAAGKGVKVLIVLAAAAWCLMLKTQFGLWMILLIAVYYLMYDRREKLLVGGILSLAYVSAPLSNFVLKRYNHQLGPHPWKYGFYALYPAHWLLLGLITHTLTKY